MTGVGPIEHGILDFTRFNPATGAEEPITSDERLVPAIWNMADQQKVRSAVLGLWATHPAEAIDGVVVSDRFVITRTDVAASLVGAVHPQSREAWVREVASDAEEAAGRFDEMRRYLPWLTEESHAGAVANKQPYSHPVSALRRILIETRTVSELARQSLLRDAPRLTILYIQGTDTIGHVFAPFAPPKQDGIDQADFAKYSRVPELYFAEIDSLIGDWIRLAEENRAVLMLASDHGFSWGEGRPTTLSSIAGPTAAKWHRADGMYVMWGSGITPAPGHTHRGDVAQVCATLLALLQMPHAKGITSPPLPGAPPVAASLGEIDYAASFKRAAPLASDPGSAEALERLRSLGYLTPAAPAESSGKARNSTRTPASYNNEGIIRRGRGDTEGAMRAFEAAIALQPGHASSCWNLSNMLHGFGRETDRSDSLLIDALRGGLADGARLTVVRALQYEKSGQKERAMKLLTRAIEIIPDASPLRVLRGKYHLERQSCRAALLDFDAALPGAPEDATLHGLAGTALLCLGDRAGAMKAFKKSLELDPAQPMIRSYLAEAE